MKKFKKKLTKILEERWKFYLITYVIGYFISLGATGIPSWTYLIPIKLSAVVLAVGIGNAFYHGSKKLPVYYMAIKGFKYAFIVAVIMGVFRLFYWILMKIGIDITPLIGY